MCSGERFRNVLNWSNRDEARKKVERQPVLRFRGAPFPGNNSGGERGLPAGARLLQEAGRHGERTPELFYNTGLILQNLGRPEEAAQQYREALAVQPDLAEATQALAQVSKAPAKVEEIRKSVRKESVLGPRLLKSR
jgi:tetratricopeptide (TPR) repeat protein